MCQSPHFVKILEIKSISKPLMIMGRNLHPLTEYINRRESFCFRDLNMPSQVDIGPDGGVIRRGLGCAHHLLVVGEQGAIFASPYSHSPDAAG